MKALKFDTLREKRPQGTLAEDMAFQAKRESEGWTLENWMLVPESGTLHFSWIRVVK